MANLKKSSYMISGLLHFIAMVLASEPRPSPLRPLLHAHAQKYYNCVVGDPGPRSAKNGKEGLDTSREGRPCVLRPVYRHSDALDTLILHMSSSGVTLTTKRRINTLTNVIAKH